MSRIIAASSPAVRTTPPGVDANSEQGPDRSPGNRPSRISIDRHVVALHAGVIGGLLVIAIIMWWRVWITGHPTSTITCQCGDVSEALGFLAWTPYAVAHGHNPFLSNAIYAGQGGANMLVNASWLAFSFVFAPITWLFGPIATFNVVVTLAPVVSGWCFFLAVRKFTTFVPGQIVAAALYGISPIIVVSEPIGHFFQIWLIYPPLAFLCLYDLFVTQRHRPVLLGIAFGVLTVVQFFTSTEVLVISCVIGLIGSVMAAALGPRAAWARRRHILLGLTVAAGTATLLLAYPLWFALAGPRHIVGAAWAGTSFFGIPFLSLLDPGKAPHHAARAFEVGGNFGAAGPYPSYIGIGIVTFLLVSAIAWHRSRLAWLVVGLGVSSWVFSLGFQLVPAKLATAGIWLPWRLFAHIPVMSDIIPSRFEAITLFAAALLLALSADSWWQLAIAHHEHRTRTAPDWRAKRFLRMSGAGIAVVTAATLVPVGATYTFPFVMHHMPMPAWFHRVAPSLAPGTVVLAYPYPDALSPQAMGWQAVNGLRYRIVGGFAIVPGQDGRDSSSVSPFGGTRAVLDSLSVDNGPLPPPTESTIRMVRESLRNWGVQVAVVTRQGRDPKYALGFFTAVLGRLPRVQDGAWVWYGLGPNPPIGIQPAALTTCVDGYTKTHPLFVPTCVVKTAQDDSGAK
jgi:hypothetical protein